MCTSAATDSADIKTFPATASCDCFTALLKVKIETDGLGVIGARTAALEPEGHSNALASALATSLLASPATSTSLVRAATISTLVGGRRPALGLGKGLQKVKDFRSLGALNKDQVKRPLACGIQLDTGSCSVRKKHEKTAISSLQLLKGGLQMTRKHRVQTGTLQALAPARMQVIVKDICHLKGHRSASHGKKE